ncbi:MAG: DUF4270 domain-containing protein [Bacteroidales bacterium]|nr:DUF4270 domain-containing protein [Bacteroidales bacterium]
MTRFKSIGLLAILVLFFSACNHEPSPIGLDLIDQVGTEFSDTTSIVAYSCLEDTINTTKMSANVVGNIHDPIFGDSKASIYAQFALSGSSVNFGDNPVIDSVVLTLQLSSYYGDTTSGVGIRVYQLTEGMSSQTHYYQNSTVAFNNTPLNYQLTNYTIAPKTSVIVDTGEYTPHIRIRLSQAFGQYLLNNQSHMSSNSDFQSFFKGLCISAISHTGSTGYMLITNMTSSLSAITLYYHNSASSTTTKYNFVCNTECPRFTNFTHEYNRSSNADFNQEVLAGDHSLGAKTLFVQATGGVKTRITFPHLQEAFKALDNRVVINRAELVITNVEPNEQFLVQPAALSIQGIEKNTGKILYLPDDEVYTSSNYFGGVYNAERQEYRFRITEYVQNLILDNSTLSNSINLVVKGSSVRANRLVFGGTGLTDEKRLRLELSYTTY